MKPDRTLGMGRDISRRDLIHGVGLAALGAACSGSPRHTSAGSSLAPGPPALNGMRGAHDGSFEVAHELARRGRSFEVDEELSEHYDLIVIGGGISGLSAAYYYRQLNGSESRILILDNHDDFGGHAKRNEFYPQGSGTTDPMRLVWGGVFNLEYPMFSDTVRQLLRELGVDLERVIERTDFHYGDDGRLGPAIYFDAATYGRDVLIPGFGIRGGDYADLLERIDQVPLDLESRESLRRFYAMDTDVLAGRTSAERQSALRQMSYIDFLRQHGGLTQAAAEIFQKSTHGYAGVGADSLSVAECRDAALPMSHLLGEGPPPAKKGATGGEVAMFPDGNATIARLLVRSLIPEVAPGRGMDDVVTERFDYAQLDVSSSRVRLRLESTAVAVSEQRGVVEIDYVHRGRTIRVSARHAVLACNHSIVPHLCPDLPTEQREALAAQVKRPLLLTNVLLRNTAAADRLGIAGAYCPGRLHGATWLVKGIEAGSYRHGWDEGGPAVMQFWGSVDPGQKGLDVREQHRRSRRRMLSMEFADFELEVRTVLQGMLGPAGFDAAEDVLAITVNRWPHGYAYSYLDLWDGNWPAGEAPHEIARRPFGRISIANADAGAQAYTHTAIDEAWRAVGELLRREE